jgi:hypothetical protein
VRKKTLTKLEAKILLSICDSSRDCDLDNAGPNGYKTEWFLYSKPSEIKKTWSTIKRKLRSVCRS